MSLPVDDTHLAALDKLCADSFSVGAQTGILEAIKLLQVRGMEDAANALLMHHKSIAARAMTYMMVEDVIRKARAA